MQLTVWTYEGPPHVGAMRIATAMEGVHYVLHAPQGDTYADLLFTMIERRNKRPPVTYTTFQARDLGKDTAELFQKAAREAYARFQPQAMLVGASCTAELIQDDPAGLAEAMGLPCPVVALELPSYQRKENWGAAETFYQLVRKMCAGTTATPRAAGAKPSANILGPTALGFRHRDDVIEITRLLATWASTSCHRPARRIAGGPGAVGRGGLQHLPLPRDRGHRLPLAGEDVRPAHRAHDPDRPWRDARIHRGGRRARRGGRGRRTRHVEPPLVEPLGRLDLSDRQARLHLRRRHPRHRRRPRRRDELGFEVVGLGCYNREFARDLREAAKLYGVEPLIADDYLAVEQAIQTLQPELVLGTQMERHVAKRLRIPCAVISAPVHVQDFPARYSPQMGFEGANVLFDTWVHPLMMGLEEHLLVMFRDDAEFSDAHGASHLGHQPPPAAATTPVAPIVTGWTADAERELLKIPFFVRGKARRNTEKYAADQGVTAITLDTLYDAKAHYAR
jgi:light-independent protochlorophyllide reductase subunit B